MNNYSDLQVTELNLTMKLATVGNPDYTVKVNNNIITGNVINYSFGLLDTISIEVELRNKVYTADYETAVIIDQISIDNINIIPEYNQIITYINDHDYLNPTNYIGFNGKWTLTIDRPFYQWLHQAQGQGWLLT